MFEFHLRGNVLTVTKPEEVHNTLEEAMIQLTCISIISRLYCMACIAKND